MSEEERLRRAIGRRQQYRSSRRADGSSYSHPVSGNSSEYYLRAAIAKEQQPQPEVVEEQEPALTCWKCGADIVDQAYKKEDGRVYCARCRNGILRGELEDKQDALLTSEDADNRTDS